MQKNNIICNKCSIPKDFEKDFYSDRKTVCKECLKEDMRKNRLNKKDEYAEKDKIRRASLDKNQVRKYNAEYKKQNPDKIYNLGVAYREKNKERIREHKRKYSKNRRETDPLYKIRGNIRCLIKNTFLSGGSGKAKKTEEILGCTLSFFIDYIVAQFTDEMSLENYGFCKKEDCKRYWEFDHIYPVSKAKSEEELLHLNHYTNFRPLWQQDNRYKGDTVECIQLRLL